MGRYHLDTVYWQGIMMDRAGNNGAAMKEIRDMNMHCPATFPCLSHTFTAPGKRFKDTFIELNDYRVAYNTSIMFRGAMNHLFKSIFGVRPKVSGGVRWYIEYEQIAEMDKIGIQRINDELIPLAIERNVSVKSVKKMQKASNKMKMPKIIVHAAAIADVGRPFCIATYLTEGDDPLVFSQYMILNNLDSFVGNGPNFVTGGNTLKRCKESAAMVVKLREESLANIASQESIIADLENDAQDILFQIEQQQNINEPL